MENQNVLNQIFKNENKAKRIFIIFVSLYFLSDIITKILLVYSVSSFNRIAGIVKLCFELIMLFYLLEKRKINGSLFLGLILLFTFLVSQTYYIIVNINDIDFNVVIKNIYFANRYLYIFIFIAFLEVCNVTFSINDNFIKLFKLAFYINSIVIIIGFLFEIELFSSYVFSSRFGYDGIFSKHGEAAYYYMFFISILYKEYILDKTTKNLLKVIAISVVSILLGKKAILLFLFLLIIMHVLFVLKKPKELTSGLLFLTVCFIFINETIISFIFKLFPFWERVYHDHGLIDTLTSIRSKLFVDFINQISSNWNALDYFFGTGEYERYKVEFEFVDVFLFFGIIGIVVFVYLFKKYFYNKDNAISKYLLLCILISSFFSGALFISVTGMMFFYVVFQCINNSEYI